MHSTPTLFGYTRADQRAGQMTTFHTDVFPLAATPAQVLSFAMNPARILDYYPGPMDCGELIAGESFWCRGTSATTLFERLPEACTEQRITQQITSSKPRRGPVSAAGLRESPMLRMKEDWIVTERDGGTLLERRFRDLETFGLLRVVPMRLIIRKTADGERQRIITHWNAAAL